MTNDDGRKPEGAPERSPKAGGGAPSGVDGNGPKRFSVQRKMAIVARLLRGAPLGLVARELLGRRDLGNGAYSGGTASGNIVSSGGIEAAFSGGSAARWCRA